VPFLPFFLAVWDGFTACFVQVEDLTRVPGGLLRLQTDMRARMSIFLIDEKRGKSLCDYR